jgi:hypothetical protein
MYDAPYYLSKRTLKKICCMNSLLSQKQHDWFPIQFHLDKLSLVKMIFRWRNHIKTVILSGTFIFQIYFLRYLVPSSSRSKYIDLTVNVPDVVKLQTNISFSLCRCTFIRRYTSCGHSLQWLSDKLRKKVIFNAFWLSTLATEACFRCTMLYREGYCSAKDLFPNVVHLLGLEFTSSHLVCLCLCNRWVLVSV